MVIQIPEFSGSRHSSPIALDDFDMTAKTNNRKIGSAVRDWNSTVEDENMQSQTGSQCSENLSAGDCVPKKENCLCHFLKPLIFMIRYYGFCPVTFDQLSCKMNHNWISWAASFNLIWLLFISFLSLFLYNKAIGFLSIYMENGTDFYTFGVVISAELLASTVVFLCGNFSAGEFAKGKVELQKCIILFLNS
jgi:hypothetical protein